MEKLVEQEIRCRITKIDVDDEDVVVDRRAIAEDEERPARSAVFRSLKKAIRCRAWFAASPTTGVCRDRRSGRAASRRRNFLASR